MILLRTIATGAAASTLLASSLFVAPALATPGQNVTVVPRLDGHYGAIHENVPRKTEPWGMLLTTKDNTDVGYDELSIAPGGFTGWHAHPAPVFVVVTEGSIDWFDSALCAAHRYNAGDSFIEHGYATHNVVNPSSTVTARFTAIRIKPTGTPFRLDEDEPSSCD